jgi:amidohydrolase
VLRGTIRTFDAALRASMPERMTRIAEGVAGALGFRATVEVKAGNPPVVNHPAAAAIARRAAIAVVGEARVVEPEPTMGGEDMAVYFDQAPGCFVFVGSANQERGLDRPHHSPFFDFDEAALAVGAEFLVRVAEEALAPPA